MNEEIQFVLLVNQTSLLATLLASRLGTEAQLLASYLAFGTFAMAAAARGSDSGHPHDSHQAMSLSLAARHVAHQGYEQDKLRGRSTL